MEQRILVVAAHPDDEVLGCGGTITRLTKEGCEVYTLILGEGITARDIKKSGTEKEIFRLKFQARKANKLMGVKEVFFSNLADNRFDTIPLLDIIKIIEEIKYKLKPDIIFTSYCGDLNIDHRLTCRAVITATRPIPGETVKEVYCFEVLSSTEWSYHTAFSPDVFFDVSSTLENKLKAMRIYASEIRSFPHPRSVEGIRTNAKFWGMKVGVRYAEAFKGVRIIK